MKTCPHCSAESGDDRPICWKCHKDFTAPVNGAPIAAVRIVDVDMPFWSMVSFMVKWAIATIPALVLLFLAGAVIVALFGGLAAFS